MLTKTKEKEIIKIFGDESCHLINDQCQVMVLGAVSVPAKKLTEVKKSIYQLKRKYGLGREVELKWTKVAQGKLEFYKEVLNYFFATPELNFRGLIIPDKSKLNHQAFEQTHDQWYYKMYFEALKILFDRDHLFEIYLDIKDTKGGQKIKQLKQIAQAAAKNSGIKKIQIVRSQEVVCLQLTDLLIGALAYQARGLKTSEAKNQLVSLIKGQIGFPLELSSPKKEKKFNCLVWEAS